MLKKIQSNYKIIFGKLNESVKKRKKYLFIIKDKPNIGLKMQDLNTQKKEKVNRKISLF